MQFGVSDQRGSGEGILAASETLEPTARRDVEILVEQIDAPEIMTKENNTK